MGDRYIPRHHLRLSDDERHVLALEVMHAIERLSPVAGPRNRHLRTLRSLLERLTS